ncbi:Nucleic acid-binding proteins superfamily isoform 1 [Hibiscus syriacus]|uniref:Nucleic acid-binding proteins superfamily isoform 1 n=1 Tax=Hibiscus syriacus TaxID=106335 RepID=A0A6A2XIW8_HIBSY|nr:Nucleic acid-binding proteins superfamily isoform 1 [Hibiscus syriacus]
MGIHMVFYFILQLPWLIRLTTSFEAGGSGCNEACGTLAIRFPFGIKTGCYNNSWFRVTCNETANGPKPFISRINLELLYLWSDGMHNLVTVNNPVIYLNCNGKGSNATTSPASVNLKDGPFVFASRYNVFGSVGCGYLAILFRNNETDPLVVCLQRRCRDPISSKFGGCSATIPENLTSYTTALRSVTEIMSPEEKEYSKRCTSTFMSDYSTQLSGISIHSTHVPASLEWRPVPCDLEASLCPVVEPPSPYKFGCNESCGNVEIPFPFGIQVGCYKSKWFRVTCNKTADGEKPFISSINMQLLNVSFYDGTVTVNNSITYSDCPGKDRKNNGVRAIGKLTGTPFFFSHIFNRFMSVGCGNSATFLLSSTHGTRIHGCKQPPCGNTMTSTVSCSTNIPPGLSSFAANITRFRPSNGNNRSCSSAFIADMRFLDSIEANSDPNNTTTSRTWTHVATTLVWATPKRGLCELGEESGTVCSPDGRYCWTSLSKMHLCVCSTDNVEDYCYLSTDVCQGIVLKFSFVLIDFFLT